jgi:RNase P/RNase MRP subunit p30
MAESMKIAGFGAVALTIPTGLMQERVAFIRHIFTRSGIENALRTDLAPTSRTELLRLLRRYRNMYDVVAVKCTNEVTARVACRDRRVDLVFFDPHNHKVRFNHSLAALLRNAVEFNLVTTLQGQAIGNVLSRTSKEMEISGVHKNRVVLSSGCLSPEMIRAPSQIAAIAAVLGLSSEQARLGVSKVPEEIILRDLKRRSREYIEEGVKVIRPNVR